MYKVNLSIKQLMKHLISSLFLLLFFSCDNEKILQLPEIDHTEITEILDVSPAYVFYDVTKPDSVELNRKNLIISTNWLVNVDKRLNLNQALPSIIFIQNKKRDSEMHKNDAAKNFYTCHYKKINNLGFIDFTNTYYHLEPLEEYASGQNIKNYHVINFNSDSIFTDTKSIKLNQLKPLDSINSKVFLRFDKSMSFQKYISYKEQLSKIDLDKLNIDNDEFIY